MEDLESRIDTLVEWMFEARRLVVFTGAGISTDSGLPDFRGPDGVWTRRDKGLPPRDSGDWTRSDPNVAHVAVFELQELGKLHFLISQNIDNLHRKSGIREELLAELHGNMARLRCSRCEKTYPRSDDPGQCRVCGGTLRSSVVDFGDSLPQQDLTDSFRHAEDCDLLIDALQEGAGDIAPVVSKGETVEAAPGPGVPVGDLEPAKWGMNRSPRAPIGESPAIFSSSR